MRLHLRAFVVSDAERLAQLAGVYSVARYAWGIPLPYSVPAAAEWIAGLRERQYAGLELMYAITCDDGLCGAVGLSLEREHGRAELGYWLAEGYRGQGYAREAVAAVCNHAFDKLALDRLYAQCMTDNLGSRHAFAISKQGACDGRATGKRESILQALKTRQSGNL